MATKKTGTLAKAGKAVKKVAKKVAATADEYVVEPVGKALGLTGKKTAARKSTGKKAAAKTTAAKSKGAAARKTPAKKTTRGK